LIVLYNREKKQNEAIKLWYKIREVAPNDPDVQRMFSQPQPTPKTG